MNTVTSRTITVAITCAILGGQCRCVYLTDQNIWLPAGDPVSAAASLVLGITLASIAPVVNSAVDDRRLDEATGKKWCQRKTTGDYLRVALTCKNADIRQFAILKVADSGEVASDWAFEGLETVASRDSSSAVRWVAVRALSGVHDPRPVRVALGILNHERDMDHVHTPDFRVRWACLILLDDFCARGLVRSAQHEAVRDAMTCHLRQSYHHDIRYTAAKGLRHFDDKASRTALTHALKDGNVVVELRAKQSLLVLASMEHIGTEESAETVRYTYGAGLPGAIVSRRATSHHKH